VVSDVLRAWLEVADGDDGEASTNPASARLCVLTVVGDPLPLRLKIDRLRRAVLSVGGVFDGLPGARRVGILIIFTDVKG
jgi:hypothetical protein